jgi:hypothetical protein
MNITNQIKTDIEAYNGITQIPNVKSSNISIPSSTSYNIFTYGTLKILLLIILILLIVWSIYNTKISTTEYNTTITSIVDYIKLTWNNLINFINTIQINNTTKSSQKINTNKDYTVTTHDNIPEIPAKDTIKAALDVNALKYTATVEQTDQTDIPGWCYIGKDTSGFGVCVQSNNSNLCESNMYFDTEEKCVNNQNTQYI